MVADVAWDPPAEATPQRLGSTICRAGVEIGVGRRWGWKPLRIPLPLKGKGWLEVSFIDESMRITRGNLGGLFVHVRPDLLPQDQDQVQEAATEVP